MTEWCGAITSPEDWSAVDYTHRTSSPLNALTSTGALLSPSSKRRIFERWVESLGPRSPFTSDEGSSLIFNHQQRFLDGSPRMRGQDVVKGKHGSYLTSLSEYGLDGVIQCNERMLPRIQRWAYWRFDEIAFQHQGSLEIIVNPTLPDNVVIAHLAHVMPNRTHVFNFEDMDPEPQEDFYDWQLEGTMWRQPRAMGRY